MKARRVIIAVVAAIIMQIMSVAANAATINLKVADPQNFGYDLTAMATTALQNSGHKVVSDGSGQYTAEFSLNSLSRKSSGATVIVFLFAPTAPVYKDTECTVSLKVTDSRGNAVFEGEKNEKKATISWLFGIVPNSAALKSGLVKKTFATLASEASVKLR